MSEITENKQEIPLGEDPNRPVRIYADGVFDQFHFGHAKLLEQCKKMYKHVTLIVGVSGQADTEKFKGATLMTEFERSESVRHCKWADEVICPCPWVIDLEFLDKHKIDFVAHDDAPYSANGQEDIYAPIKKVGKFKATQRTEGISTSDLIMRVLKERDKFLMRNLSRGYSRKDLDLSYADVLMLKVKYFLNNIEQNLVPCRRRKRKNIKEE